MADTIYRYYRDEDAEQVVDLLVRNRFYLGKTGERIPAELYRYYQKKRGMRFAVVAEKDGLIIGHVAVYPTGCQRVMGRHQVIMDTLLIDKEYQRHMYSMVNMFRMVLNGLRDDEELTTMISEVAFTNRQSMLMQRQFGALKLNDEPDCYGQNEMYNFVLGILKLFDPVSESCRQPIERFLTPVNKASYDTSEEIIGGKYVEHEYRLSYGPAVIRFHIDSGYPVQITVKDRGLTVGLEDPSVFLAENRSDTALRLKAELFAPAGGEPEVWEKEIAPGETLRLPIPADTDALRVALEGLPDIFRFYPSRVRDADPPAEEPEQLAPGRVLEKQIGFLRISDGDKPLMTEMWPCLRIPYITGSITPNYTLNLTAENTGDGRCTVTERADGMTVVREYSCDGSATRVATRAKLKAEELDPAFHFVLDDLDTAVDLTATDGSTEHKTYNYERDVKSTIAEMLYIDLLREPYALKPLDHILLRRGGKQWSVTFDKPVKAYYQYNYVGIQYDRGAIAEEDGWFDFGGITVKEIG